MSPQMFKQACAQRRITTSSAFTGGLAGAEIGDQVVANTCAEVVKGMDPDVKKSDLLQINSQFG
eukprot:9436184-Alexandrium_andersonii.AAC.1